jgi:hypothetical protein
VLLVNSPANSTQVEGSNTVSSNHNLELSRIGGPVLVQQDCVQVTSVQPEDMILIGVRGVAESINHGDVSSVSMLHTCHCGKECTR